ncbi:MAG: DNA repair protein RecN [Synechococcus sp.]
MLTVLRITNFALIEHIELEFSAGLNVLTGETGAGKSIILDALDAALGGTVSGKLVRTGSKKASIEAVFRLTGPLRQWLQQQEIDEMDEGLVCSREIGDRTSRSRLNGILVNRQQLQELRRQLVEIAAQGQTVQLQNSNTQRRWLDGFGGSRVESARRKVKQAFEGWTQARKALEESQQRQQQRLQQQDMLEFQHRELSEAELESPDEIEQLVQERDRLAHSVELQQQSYEAYNLLYQNDAGESASDLLGKVAQVLEQMCRFDPQVQTTLDMISSAAIQVGEASRELSTYSETLDTDPERLEAVGQRMALLKQICRKYGPTLADAIGYAETVEQELQGLQEEGSIEELQDLELQRHQELKDACARLTELRRKTGEKLRQKLLAELKPMAMAATQFAVEIQPVEPTAEGQDRVGFTISPNPGEPMQPLADTASGGEMSRFLLAMKAVFTRVNPVSTLVFDEIDVGVSGKVAQAIATKLHDISQGHQVLCVTHQPLVAAMADSHFQVSKTVRKQRTFVQVQELSEEHQRRDELAQLAGGKSAQDALDFAEALLAQAAELRHSA